MSDNDNQFIKGKLEELRGLFKEEQDYSKDIQSRIGRAIEVACRFGQIDGSHHKAWVIDQMVRELTGEKYAEVIKTSCGDDYSWDEGIAP